MTPVSHAQHIFSMSNLLTAEITGAIESKTGVTVIITVGNTLRSDDGVGPYIAEALQPAPSNIKILNAGFSPENIIDEVVLLNPKQILVIDAADFNGIPGEIKIIDKNHIPESSLSTHLISLKVIAYILESDTKAVVKFLGIQPENVKLGEGLSERVKNSADKIINIIKERFYNA